ncbi:predicted protein [Naegleria gruberi]|uniref:Predicted protein n=1 Tax=Naegleria gruberi TaxID=5762 RepID=D2V1H0_NAEGR|nr:uncharacterized protein NAEGRDRAFT_62576 [Naegleria gruberi]EFC49304.1 predicted protein [Naegleria gruberi]|eukprot:XP_002682048.1 predicted protein [Naegleria gruberi strain NEG-M]
MQATPTMDKETALAAIQKSNYAVFSNISDELKEDADIVRMALNVMGSYIFNKIPSVVFERDRDLALLALSKHCPEEKLITLRKNDKEFVLAVCKKRISMLRLVAKELWEDKEFIEGIIPLRPSLEHFPLELRDDKEIVKRILSSDGSQFQFISERLKMDDELLMLAAASDIYLFAHTAPRILSKELCLEIIHTQKSSGYSFPEYLKMDRDIVKAHLTYYSGYNVFNLVDKSFTADEEIVTQVLCRDCEKYQFIDDSLKNNVDFIGKMLELVPSLFRLLPVEQRKEKEIALAAMKDGNNLSLLSEELRDDKQVVMKAVSHTGKSIRYASKLLRHDEQVIEAALLNDQEAFVVLSKLGAESKLVGTYRLALDVGEHSKYNHDTELYDLVLRENNSFKYLKCDISEDYDAGYPRVSYKKSSGNWRIDKYQEVEALFLDDLPFMSLTLLNECTKISECEELTEEDYGTYFSKKVQRDSFKFSGGVWSERL